VLSQQRFLKFQPLTNFSRPRYG